jgi:glutathione synthase/RimK-type ligase-like ATP-grasp enzyme
MSQISAGPSAGKRVLILSKDDDFHAVAIQGLLQKRGADADIVDTALFPGRLRASLAVADHDGGGAAVDVRLGDRPLGDYHAIWWRRPLHPAVDPRIRNTEERRFAARECREALWGLLAAAGRPIYNDPEAEQRAAYKPYQLAVAAAIGLDVPPTLIGNDAEEVRAFAERHDAVIYKAFSGTDLMMTDTRPLRPEDLADLWRLDFAPVIFQRYIPRGREYRVMLIGDDAFVTEVTIRNPKAHYDWRLDQDYGLVQATLPAGLIETLLVLRRRLGLASGAVDLREDPDGRIFFLEINPSGQFLFLDVIAGTRTGERYCDLLLS